MARTSAGLDGCRAASRRLGAGRRGRRSAEPDAAPRAGLSIHLRPPHPLLRRAASALRFALDLAASSCSPAYVLLGPLLGPLGVVLRPPHPRQRRAVPAPESPSHLSRGAKPPPNVMPGPFLRPLLLPPEPSLTPPEPSLTPPEPSLTPPKPSPTPPEPSPP